ncbi:pyridoxal phosphate-dependent transferase [Amanita rubescens]|nr:pyridoxal phosphate-dependent transferase [Amanita rubescens]
MASMAMFTYTETLKILQKWGPGCHFFENGLDSDIDKLAKMLVDQGPILALFAEFPSNPLLRSVNLPRLRALADDIVNVEVIQYTDIVVSGFTGIFSGDANVMGGSLVLNPQGRDFKRRIWRINANTEAVCNFLCSRSIAGGNTSPDTVIKQVFHPKYSTPENYERCRKKKGEDEEGGYGGLFSLTFTSRAASEAFFDALQCFKGPSLGTNFTLACPYTILAWHYGELDWAAGFGVEAGLVRVSVGMEDKDDLLKLFEVALNAAQIQAQGESQ